MVRKFVVLTVMAIVGIAVPTAVGNVSAAEGIAPLTQFISATVGNEITPSTAYTSTGITGTKVFAVSPSLPRGLTLDTTTGVVSGTPTAAKAAAAYTVTATDGALSATATITIQVNAVATLSPASQTVTGLVGSPITATAAYTKVGLGVSTFVITPAVPAGLTFNASTGILSGTPTEAKAATTFQVSAGDGTSYANAAIRLTITAPPTLTPATQTISARAGTSITSTTAFTASGMNASINYTISPALPAGLSMSATTGVISGTPTTTAESTHVVTANDGTTVLTARIVISIPPAAPPTTTTVAPTLSEGCAAPTIDGASRAVIDVPRSMFKNLEFACGMRIAIKAKSKIVVAIAYQGTTINSKVSQYTVTLKKVGGGSLVRKVVVKATPLVARLTVGPVAKGTWLVTIAGLASDGTVFESYTTARFTVARR
jgi:hypothetical protein